MSGSQRERERERERCLKDSKRDRNILSKRNRERDYRARDVRDQTWNY